MNKSSNDTKILQLRQEAKKLTDDIVRNQPVNEIPAASNALTKFLFTYPYLLYSDVNDYLKSSDIINVLIKSLEGLQDQSKRDVLRLINLLLHINQSMCDLVRHSEVFQAFMLKSLSRPECWENRQRFKHHISVASQLLMNQDAWNCCFNTEAVRKLCRNTISSLLTQGAPEYESRLSCAIFYACSMFKDDLDEIPTNVDGEPAPDKVLDKELTGKCLDIIREYVQDFKVFYTRESEEEKAAFLLYKPRSEYSFQQICKTLVYYSFRSESLRMNIFQGGIYCQINNLLSLKYLPEPLLLWGLDIFKLSLLDEPVLKGVKNDNLKLINEKLNALSERKNISEKAKSMLRYLLTIFSTPENGSFDIPSEVVEKPPRKIDDQIIHITNMGPNEPIPFDNFGVEYLGQQDVHYWFSDNNLEDLREHFPRLTGRGLRQLKLLASYNNDKMKTVDFLMQKINIDFEATLELIGALEKLD